MDVPNVMLSPSSHEETEKIIKAAVRTINPNGI
jgi:hypothetical protein